MVIATDDNAYALEWTLDQFFVPFTPNHPFKLVIIYAKTIPHSIVGHDGPGAADALPFIEKNIKINAFRVVEKAKEIYAERSVNEVTLKVVEGGADARHVICEAVEKHNATMLVLGSRGHDRRLKRYR
ncbi:hypothetical protein Scep_030705 [Stephania cephalantha]|uniref:UspA domain-containing protein n=1 Tax=Stephania cephalantha TaxID=152367 RepID=A0AAP0E7T3_9MAGN